MLSLTYTISFLVIALAILIVNSLYIGGCLQSAMLYLRYREYHSPPMLVAGNIGIRCSGCRIAMHSF